MFYCYYMLDNGEGVDVNKEEALKYLKMAIKKGNSTALSYYAQKLFHGDGVPKNKEDAFHYYEMAIEKGNENAMFLYSNIIKEEKESTPEMKQKALNYFKIAADKGHAKSMNNYAYMLHMGDGVPVNKEEAAKYYKMAINEGLIEAMVNYASLIEKDNKLEAEKYYKMAINEGFIAAMHNYGLMKEDDGEIEEALKYFKMAADKGYVDSMFRYAQLLQYETNGDKKEALKYYKMAADNGNVLSMNNYASLLFIGDGVEVNKEESRKYLKMAIDKGSIDAIENYAKVLLSTENENDKEEALKWLKIAADKGNNDAKELYFCIIKNSENYQSEEFKEYKQNADNGDLNAMVKCATMLFEGDGVSINQDEGIRYLKIAIEKGDSHAMNIYAVYLYEKGQINESLQYLKMSADVDGNHKSLENIVNILLNHNMLGEKAEEYSKYIKMGADCQINICVKIYGMMLRHGIGMEIDLKESAKYYKMSADNGDVIAMKSYAAILRNGDGVEVDNKEAFKYYKMAADNDNVDSMMICARMLEKGDGVDRNLAGAMRYYKMADIKGNPNARYYYFQCLQKHLSILNGEDDDDESEYDDNSDKEEDESDENKNDDDIEDDESDENKNDDDIEEDESDENKNDNDIEEDESDENKNDDENNKNDLESDDDTSEESQNDANFLKFLSNLINLDTVFEEDDEENSEIEKNENNKSLKDEDNYDYYDNSEDEEENQDNKSFKDDDCSDNNENTKIPLKKLQVCGMNHFNVLSQDPNDTNTNSPLKSSIINTETILSYSIFGEHSVLITNDGVAQAIGDNHDGRISRSLPLEKFNKFIEIILKDKKGHQCVPISVVCGLFYTLYMISDPENKGKSQLAFSSDDIKSDFPVILNTNGLNPVALFGGCYDSAAIDDEGKIIFISNWIKDSPDKPLSALSLPNEERAIRVCICRDFIVSLCSSGRLFISSIEEPFAFSLVDELKDIEIIDISGCFIHCLAVSKDGKVFGYGSNFKGKIGLGKKEKDSNKFVIIPALKKYKIVSVYAGIHHSLFQTYSGKILACGENDDGELFLKNRKHIKAVWKPSETSVLNGASFCIAGKACSVVFSGFVPPNNPNKVIQK